MKKTFNQKNVFGSTEYEYCSDGSPYKIEFNMKGYRHSSSFTDGQHQYSGRLWCLSNAQLKSVLCLKHIVL